MMRLNLKKILIGSLVLTVLWLLISYSSFIEVKRPVANNSKYRQLNIESKIDKLQRQLDDQLVESNLLLDKVKLHLKKTAERSKNTDVEEKKDILQEADGNLVLPVLVIACDRVTVKRCLDNLVKLRPDRETFPIIVSQDCGHRPTYEVIKSYTEADPTISVVRQPDLSEIPLPSAKAKFSGYYKIARHYKFALNYVFETLGHDAVIIVEDDLDIAHDFFEYFLGSYPLLQKDPSLWCISAWNDNGKKGVIDMSRPELLHRTDFFPGLGWMLRRDTWRDLVDRWPPAFFDDWLRNPENVNERACIRPEISRTYSFGKIGVSKGLFFDMHLRNIHLNTDFVEFTKLNLTYLLKEYYDDGLSSLVNSLPVMSADEAISSGGGDKRPAKVLYSDAKTFQKAAKKLGLMDDFRSGVPRTAYRGIVVCFVRGRRVYLAPDFVWVRYDPVWG